MLKGLRFKPLQRFCDERGYFTEIVRKDWKDLLENDEFVQANLSMTYPGVIRAWHRHGRGQVDYFIVLKGTLKICAYDDRTEEMDEMVSTGLNLQVLRIPGQYWHGFKAMGDEEALLIYFTTNLYEYENPDEERRPWNDPRMVPKLVNGKKDDPRAGMPWDWDYPPHR